MKRVKKNSAVCPRNIFIQSSKTSSIVPLTYYCWNSGDLDLADWIIGNESSFNFIRFERSIYQFIFKLPSKTYLFYRSLYFFPRALSIDLNLAIVLPLILFQEINLFALSNTFGSFLLEGLNFEVLLGLCFFCTIYSTYLLASKRPPKGTLTWVNSEILFPLFLIIFSIHILGSHFPKSTLLLPLWNDIHRKKILRYEVHLCSKLSPKNAHFRSFHLSLYQLFLFNTTKNYSNFHWKMWSFHVASGLKNLEYRDWDRDLDCLHLIHQFWLWNLDRQQILHFLLKELWFQSQQIYCYWMILLELDEAVFLDLIAFELFSMSQGILLGFWVVLFASIVYYVLLKAELLHLIDFLKLHLHSKHFYSSSKQLTHFEFFNFHILITQLQQCNLFFQSFNFSCLIFFQHEFKEKKSFGTFSSNFCFCSPSCFSNMASLWVRLGVITNSPFQ